MPTYTVKYSNINLSQKQKNSIANDITNTHSKYTGANTFFAQVIFQKNEKNAHFMGGKLVKTKEIFLLLKRRYIFYTRVYYSRIATNTRL